ncbi:putative R-directed D polymerase from mobile element jockey-like [Daphnia sinensis]|uniref:R-directed D polymerase from mobile element jockey-like n=1 Tax=Daphnia sinensis TaxID=1820382 RepID=A0AAD5PXZ1_9CRUS|nr:putative R-directed D polymerase from mobile element jockey-like [Daphnia sinensis]
MTGRSFNNSAAWQDLLSSSGSRITNLKEKANLLIDSILERRNANQSTKNEIKSSIEKALKPTSRNPFNSTVTKDEVNRALTKLKSKAVGPDNIHNRMLANLSPDNRDYMRHLFDLLLRHGFTPQAWKEATIIPILKPNKQPNDPLLYRPISLTSCLSKIMERILNNRINWHLETRNLLQPTQAGFRPNRSTIDHIISLENDVMTGFSNKLPTYAAFLDIAKAFDRTSTDGVLFKLGNLGINGNILKWINSVLTRNL